ncbi:MAG: YeeE/YedE thiosulfate transporter family protein [Devosia sp.]
MTTDSVESRPVPTPDSLTAIRHRPLGSGLFWYLGLGCLFGIVLIKSEAVSWFRIQEMFRFQAFHMYGIIMSAIAVAALSLVLLRLAGAHTLARETISIQRKELGRGYRYWIGGTLFGVGWALTGACPGPLFALTGSGLSVYAVAVVSALGGTWLYGFLRPHLPHY